MLKIYSRPLEGRVKVPASKSIGHRVMICAALASGESIIEDLQMSRDLEATMEALKNLGANFEKLEAENAWKVTGIYGGEAEENLLVSQRVEIRCEESGSTLRFMIPVTTALRSNSVYTGSGRLVERPIDEYFPIFKACDIDYQYNGCLPLELSGKLKAGTFKMSGKVSSQYTSGMLMAAPLLDGETHLVIEDEMESKAYIDLTIDTMAQFGIEVMREGHKFFSIGKETSYKSKKVKVEADYSQAAFWIVAGLMGSSPITIQGLREDSVQGDAEILQIAKAMGGSFEWLGSDLLVKPSQTRGVEIDASQCPDLIPVVCVLAALSEGRTRVYNGQRLRVKESDRIKATVSELKKLGADIQETEDGMIVIGKASLTGNVTIESWGDHRIVMAMAVAAIRSEKPIYIQGADAVCKSYPKFFLDYLNLGGQIDGQYIW